MSYRRAQMCFVFDFSYNNRLKRRKAPYMCTIAYDFTKAGDPYLCTFWNRLLLYSVRTNHTQKYTNEPKKSIHEEKHYVHRAQCVVCAYTHVEHTTCECVEEFSTVCAILMYNFFECL